MVVLASTPLLYHGKSGVHNWCGNLPRTRSKLPVTCPAQNTTVLSSAVLEFGVLFGILLSIYMIRGASAALCFAALLLGGRTTRTTHHSRGTDTRLHVYVLEYSSTQQRVPAVPAAAGFPECNTPNPPCSALTCSETRLRAYR